MIYELGLMGRASTNRLRVVLSPHVHRGSCGQKWLKMSKSKRDEIELRSFHQSIRLDELIILVGSFVQIGCKMTEL